MNQIISIYMQTYRNKEHQIENQHSSPNIKILLFNKLERAAKTYAQVMAIEKVEARIEQFEGLNHYLIFQELQQQYRFMEQFEMKYINTDRQGEFEEAKIEYNKIQIILQQMLSKENQKFIESVNKQISQINNQPILQFIELLNTYHFKSQIDFHNLLINDPKGQELQQSMRDYSQRLSQYLYFLFIKEQDPNLIQLLNFILINKTQSNTKILEILNNYIKSLIQKEQYNVVQCLNNIISIFNELSNYFQNIIEVINHQIQLDNKLELNEKQFNIILLILDNSNSECIDIDFYISQSSSNILRQILWIYNNDCSQQFIISQQKQLTQYLSKDIDQNIILDLTQMLMHLRSVKLKLLIERIIEFHYKKEKEINLQFLEFNIYLPQDQETLQRHVQSFENQENQQQYQRIQNPIIPLSTDIQVKKIVFSFLNILSFAAYLDQKKIDSIHNKELSKLISDEIECIGTKYDPNLFVTRQKIRQALVYFLQLQKLELNTFKEIWRLSEQLRLHLENVQQFIRINTLDRQFFPSLNQILSTYIIPQNESFEFKMLKNQIYKDLFRSTNDYLYNDFNEVMNLIEQYSNKNEQKFLQSVKPYYKKDFKQHLEKLKSIGSYEVQNAIDCIFVNLKS